MVRSLRAVPAVLVALVALLSMSLAAVPVYAAGSSSYWDRDLTRQEILDRADANGFSSGHLIPGFMAGRAGAARAASNLAGAASAAGRRFGNEAINTAGVMLALGAAWSWNRAGDQEDGQAPSKAATRVMDKKVEGFKPDMGGSWVPPSQLEGGKSLAHLFGKCGFYVTPLNGSATGTALEGGVGMVMWTRALVRENDPYNSFDCEGTQWQTAGYHAWCRNMSSGAYESVTGAALSVNPRSFGGDTVTMTCSPGSMPFFINGGGDAAAHAGAGEYATIVHDGGVYVFEGMEDMFEQWYRDNVRQRVEITCRDGSGFERRISGMSDAGGKWGAGMPECPSGYAPVGYEYEMVDPINGAANIGLGAGKIDPETQDRFPNCLGPAALLCSLSTLVDGIACTDGRPECVDWYRTALATPDRVECKWGPYTLPWADCEAIRHAYAGYPVAADPGVPGYYPLQPVSGPGGGLVPSFGGAPGPGLPDPGYAPSLGCPAPPVSAHRLSGLTRLAREGLGCILAMYPDVSLSSGYRTEYVGHNSDHPRGLAVDVTRADWATESGRTRLWEVAGGIVSRADVWGVRYVIFDNNIWTRGSGWVPYTYSGPATGADARHENHIHISFGPSSSTGTELAPGANPYSPPNPAPNPAPNPNPNPDPSRPPDPHAPPGGPGAPPVAPPGGGGTVTLPPIEGQNCDGSAIGWNPVSWVVVPLQCLFVPTTDVQAAVEDRVDDFGQTGAGGWLMAPVQVGNEISALGGGGAVIATPLSFGTAEAAGASGVAFPELRAGSGAALPVRREDTMGTLSAGEDGDGAVGPASWGAFGCQGPALTVDLGFVGSGVRTIYPLTACTSPMSTIAGIVRAGLALMINATAALAVPRLVMSVMGLQKVAEPMMSNKE